MTSDFVHARTVTVPLGLWIVTTGWASTLKCFSSRSADALGVDVTLSSRRLGTRSPAAFQWKCWGRIGWVLIGCRSLDRSSERANPLSADRPRTNSRGPFQIGRAHV